MNFEDKILDSWRKNAPQWSKAVQLGQIESRKLVTNQAIINVALSQFPDSVLDLGCGEGWLIRELAPQVKHLVGIDVAPALIERANTGGGGQFMVASYEEVANGAIGDVFDVVVCNFSLIGKESVEAAFRAIPSLLKSSGVFIVQTLHPMFSTNQPYLEGWRDGSWEGFGSEFTDPAPWYFRTLKNWISLFLTNGLQILDIREPINPNTQQPASIILMGAMSY